MPTVPPAYIVETSGPWGVLGGLVGIVAAQPVGGAPLPIVFVSTYYIIAYAQLPIMVL